MNGVGMIAEGVMRGHQAFGALAMVSTLASAAMVLTLSRTGTTLVGVWMAFTVFTTVRVTGALAHHQFFGPLSRRAARELSDNPPLLAKLKTSCTSRRAAVAAAERLSSSTACSR